VQPCQQNSRGFFEKLQNAEGLDLRDNRGKRHDLAVIFEKRPLAFKKAYQSNNGRSSNIGNNHFEFHELSEQKSPIRKIQRWF
jgi:hypothetical protein